MNFYEASGGDLSSDIREAFSPLAKLAAGGEPFTLPELQQRLNIVAWNLHHLGHVPLLARCEVREVEAGIAIDWERS